MGAVLFMDVNVNSV